MRYVNTLSLLALASTSLAQTFSDCDPTKKTGCPSKPGLSTAEFSTDFRKGADAAKDFKTTTGSINYIADGAEYSITKLGEGPTIQSNFYIQFGYVEVVMKAAPGAGIVSSFVMQSDALDEIDWEWIGSDNAKAQSNYFGKGNTTTYDRGQFHPATPVTTFTKYAVNWTQETTTWFINDAPVRTLNFADAVGGKNYPQTPMNIRFGNWVAGSPGNSPGTIEWAGGLADFSKGPFNMVVQSVKVINYTPATSYAYKDMSGSFQSIEALGSPAQASVDSSSSSGSSNSTGPGAVPFASASGSASGSSETSSPGSAHKPGSGAKPSVVSINLGGASGQGPAAAAATKSPCSTVSGTGAQGPAAAATGGSKPSVVSINVGQPDAGMGPGAAAATAMSGSSSGSNSTRPAGQGIVAAGAPATNGTLPTVTINAGGAGSAASGMAQGAAGAASTMMTGIMTAPPEGAMTATAANGATTFGIGSSTTSAGPLQVTTNAAPRLEMGGVAVAAFAGLMAAW